MSEAIQLPTETGSGKDREVQTLFADDARKLTLIRLRNGALLYDHSARFPITIQGVAGKGTLRVGDAAYSLVPGTIVPVDAHEVHSVQAEPALAILVSFFRQAESQTGNDTSARFD
jgi:quercetin dioxygenase-like cupin family protein